MEKPPDDFHEEGLTASDRIELATLGLLDQYAGFRGTAMQALDVGTP